MAGFLSSLGQALPYALPFAVGTALGGPGVGLSAGMEGAGLAAQSQQASLGPALQLLRDIGQQRFQTGELGLRKEQIEATKEMKEAQLQSTQAYREGMLGMAGQRLDEQKTRDQEMAQSRQALLALAQQRETDSMQMRGLTAQLAMARDQEAKQRLQAQIQAAQRNQIQRAVAFGQTAAKDAEGQYSYLSQLFKGPPSESKDDYVQRHRIAAIRQDLGTSGLLDKDKLTALGADPEVIAELFPQKKEAGLKNSGAPTNLDAWKKANGL